MVKFRVLLDLTEIKRRNIQHRKVWIFVSPQSTKYIKNLKTNIVKKFNIEGTVNLFINEGLLLDDDEVVIIQKDDIIKLQYEENQFADKCNSTDDFNELSFKSNNIESEELRPRSCSPEVLILGTSNSSSEYISKRRRCDIKETKEGAINSGQESIVSNSQPSTSLSTVFDKTKENAENSEQESIISNRQLSTALSTVFHKLNGRTELKAGENENKKNNIYEDLLKLDNVELILNEETFDCPICFSDIAPREGVILKNCMHSFCKECLKSHIKHSDTVQVQCPFYNEMYRCEVNIQEREIKNLVTPEAYEQYLLRSMTLAENQASNSFHCKTPDCLGWCISDPDVNVFLCPACQKQNCVTCAAIHEGKNCKEYQHDALFSADNSKEAQLTKDMLQKMLTTKKAMHCPTCQIILIKNGGCDGMTCSMCKTDICWATRGPRWGPKGRGDKSGGCKCTARKICHPKCKNCH